MGPTSGDSPDTTATTLPCGSTTRHSSEVDVNSGAKEDRIRLLGPILLCVCEQADDEGLWFRAVTAPEAYLQQELRRLHAEIEKVAEAAGATSTRKEGVGGQ